MKVALGLKAHSGWAALVVLGKRGADLQVVDRRRMELVEMDAAAWAKQPYHAADHLPAPEARDLVGRGVEAARRIAIREMRATVERVRQAGHEVAAGAVLMGDPMPAWSVAEILAVHFRMHKAEGVLFRDALARAVVACGVLLIEVSEKHMEEAAGRALGTAARGWKRRLAALGESVGPPWGRDSRRRPRSRR